MGLCAALALLAPFFVCCGTDSAYRYERYDDAELYASGDVALDAEGISKVEIDWIGGNVEVAQGAGTEIAAYEETRSGGEAERMHYYRDGNVLKIRYCSSGHRGKIEENMKHLRLEIPKGMALEIDSEKADVFVDDIEVNKFSVETDSGSVEIERLICTEAEIETESGHVDVGEIKAQTLHAESETGSIQFGVSDCLTAEIESERGDVMIYLLEEVGLKIRFETKNGSLQTERAYEQADGEYVFGNGAEKTCGVKVKTPRGNLYIR